MVARLRPAHAPPPPPHRRGASRDQAGTAAVVDVIVGRVNDFPVGTTRVVTVANRRIAVFRTRTGFYGLRDVCPHQGAALSKGTLLSSVQATSPGCYDYQADREYIRCPWHG